MPNDFFLSYYNEKANIGESHILSIDNKEHIVYSKSDVSYKIVGDERDIKEFNRCVDVSYNIVDSKITFTGYVREYGIYNVDIQPIVKGITLSQFDWWNSSYNYRMKCVIQPAFAPVALSDFPVFVGVYNTTRLARMDGNASVRFVAGDTAFGETANVTLLSFEQDMFNVSYKAGWWVRRNITGGVSDTFYLYYNNSDAVNIEDSRNDNVWDSDYIGVYHFSEANGNIHDSSLTGNHATVEDGASPDYHQSGDCGYSVNFDGSTDGFNIPNNMMSGTDQPACLYAHAKFDVACPSGTEHLICMGSDNYYWIIYHSTRTQVEFKSFHGVYNNLLVKDCNMDTNNFAQYAGSSTGNFKESYYNGGYVGASGAQCDESASGPNSIGYYGAGNSYYFNGKLDETRISSVDRSHSWISAVWNTTNAPLSFCSVGEEEEQPAGAVDSPPYVSYWEMTNNSVGNDCQNLTNMSFQASDDDDTPPNIFANITVMQNGTVTNTKFVPNLGDGDYFFIAGIGCNCSTEYRVHVNLSSNGTVNNSWINFSSFTCNESEPSGEGCDCDDIEKLFEEYNMQPITLSDSLLMLVIFVIFVVLAEWKKDVIYYMFASVFAFIIGKTFLDSATLEPLIGVIFIMAGVYYAVMIIVRAFEVARKGEVKHG